MSSSLLAISLHIATDTHVSISSVTTAMYVCMFRIAVYRTTSTLLSCAYSIVCKVVLLVALVLPVYSIYNTESLCPNANDAAAVAFVTGTATAAVLVLAKDGINAPNCWCCLLTATTSTTVALASTPFAASATAILVSTTAITVVTVVAAITCKESCFPLKLSLQLLCYVSISMRLPVHFPH
jgi:hypothetical protein